MTSVEKRNKPTVTLLNRGFIHDAMSAASRKGVPGLRLVPESVPSECTVMEQVEAGVDAVLNEIIDGLTKPLTAEEKSPVKEIETIPRIVFKGNFKEVNRFFYKRGWGDGLPVALPTEEAVAEMLTGTDLPPDHLVGKLPQRLGKATVEKIAINAVMAGALPIYMPVIIAAVQTLKSTYWSGSAMSGGSWAPLYLMNGPIRNDLHINSGVGVLSPGDIANATIGRTMYLITQNISGIRKGIETMSNFGNSGRYTQVIAENEEESPWEPLHVQHGFNKEDSTVTITTPSSFLVTPGGGAVDTNPDTILRFLSYYIGAPEGGICILLNAVFAKILADAGWTKQTIVEFLADFGRAPLYQVPIYWVNGVSIPIRTQTSSGQEGMLLNVKDNPTELVPKISRPTSLRVFVCGGTYSTMAAFTGASRFVTQKVDLPTNWNKLVKKYKDVVPTYALY